MRIISGIYKGRKIDEPYDKSTRPLKDLTKESIFNLLSHSRTLNFKIKGTKILDVFAGTGSFGIECMSRGASNVLFIENYPSVLNVLNKNIRTFKLENFSKVIISDVFETNIFKSLNDKFDLIFLDPPYKQEKVFNLFKRIESGGILHKKSLIVIHRYKKKYDEIPKKFKKIEERTYGVSKILFYTLN